MLRVLAADDEAPALEELTYLLRRHPRVQMVHPAADAAEALRDLGHMITEGERLDAVFLDIRMPGLDGLDFTRLFTGFADPPAVVFVTAHDEFAVTAFELGAVDYLLKPVSRRRLDDALARVAATRATPSPAVEGDDLVPVPTTRGGTRLLARASILYVQAYGDYVRIHSDEGRFLLREALSDVEERWEPFGFARVHRGYLANLRRATEVRPRENGTAVLVLEDGSEVPIARRQVTELRRRLQRRP
jgi:DNA-binding LytR/AlgR family response regulator